jgi:hypothetical protein
MKQTTTKQAQDTIRDMMSVWNRIEKAGGDPAREFNIRLFGDPDFSKRPAR